MTVFKTLHVISLKYCIIILELVKFKFARMIMQYFKEITCKCLNIVTYDTPVSLDCISYLKRILVNTFFRN